MRSIPKHNMLVIGGDMNAQIAYGIPKETVAAITILYRNTKVKVRSPDGDTEYFDIVAGVLQGDTVAPYNKYSLHQNHLTKRGTSPL